MPKDPQALTHARLKELLSYDPGTGLFTRLQRAGPALIGHVANVSGPCGYDKVSVAGHSVFAHRLAWFYVHGTWPDGQIDHVNGRRKDNRIANLRQCSSSDNNCNRAIRSDNTTGFPRVQRKKNRFMVEIVKQGKRFRLYGFRTAQEAYEASKEFAAKLHGSFAHHLSQSL